MKFDQSQDQENMMERQNQKKSGPSNDQNKKEKSPSFQANLIRNKEKDSYIEQVAPKLSNALGEEGKNLTKSTVDFLTGKHEFGGFSKSLGKAVNEMKTKGFTVDRVVDLVERTYGELSKQQRQINGLPERD